MGELVEKLWPLGHTYFLLGSGTDSAAPVVNDEDSLVTAEPLCFHAKRGGL